jgi:hypothetical protein
MHGKFLDSTTVPLCQNEPSAFKNAHEKDPNRTQPVQNPNRISPHKGRSPATRRYLNSQKNNLKATTSDSLNVPSDRLSII